MLLGRCLLCFTHGLRNVERRLWNAVIEFAKQGDELVDNYQADEQILPFFTLGQNCEELKELVDAFVDAFHIP